MTIWHWVRHGPTHEKTMVGWRDVPADLSDKEQIARLNAHLPDDALLVSSDLIRAIATADVLTHRTRNRLPHDPNLRELDFGDWDGLHAKDVSDLHPELSWAYWTTPGDIAPPNGESWNQAARRINAAVDKLNTAYPNAHIIAVAHFGAILTQVQRALGVGPKDAMAHKIDNLSTTEIHFGKDGWQVPKINHTP
ncbi:histidine phosphatase family protein [Sulfitobacter sp.]|uniref:histidine phosphatase family protein n=1 Tax=Sulfitobacter sp. TaxID=1903071 RepID=UPI0035635B65|tara:strand:- start:4333 stop:4914 length:582 start_codon:yes stop_codon:yes gene_type:complete